MSDKLRSTFPIAVSFTDGEMPSAAKLNGLSSQARQGLSLVEYALGDLWNQSGDSLLATASDVALMIPNMARYVGQPKLVSPRIPYLPNIEWYYHQITSDQATRNQFRLPFPPAAGTTYTWDNGWNATPETNKTDVDAANEWWIDTETGDIFSYDKPTLGDMVKYEPVIAGDLGDSHTFNMIPDPATDSYDFRGVKLQYKNGTDDSEGYYIFLPPRQPLNTNRRVDSSPQDSVHSSPAHSNNFSTSPSTERLFWQDDSVAADTSSNAEHYRYCLPEIITDNWSQASSIPTGLVYLYDPNSTGTIIEGLVFAAENSATPRKYVLVTTGSNLSSWLSTSQGLSAYPTARLQSSSHDAAYYPNNGLRLITIGSDLTKAFSSLLQQYLNHDHGSQGSLVGQPVPHSSLSGLFDVAATGVRLEPPANAFDDHAQYLHRAGYHSRDRFNNGMYGDLLMLSTHSTSNYQNMTQDSRGILFGDPGTEGGALFWDYSELLMTLQTPNISLVTTGFGLRRGTSGNAFLKFEYQTSLTGVDISAPSPLTIRNTSLDFNITAAREMIFIANPNTSDGNVSFKFQPNSGHIEFGQDLSTSSKIYIGERADNTYLVWNPSPEGWIMYVDGDCNNSSCQWSWPGAIEIRSTGYPQLKFYRGSGSYDTRIKNMSLGNIVISRDDKTYDGQDCDLTCNRLWTGRNEDSTYGSSGGSYGPVREMFISPAEFVFFTNSGNGYTSTGLAPDPNDVDDDQYFTVGDPTLKMYSTMGSPYQHPDEFVGVLRRPSSYDYMYAFGFINICAARYVIVGAKMLFRHRIYVGTTPGSAFFAALGWQYVSGSGANVDIEEDLRSANIARGSGAALAVDTWSSYFDVFPIVTSSYYSYIDQDEPGNGKRPWFRLRTVDTAIGNIEWEWRGVAIQYRIYER